MYQEEEEESRHSQVYIEHRRHVVANCGAEALEPQQEEAQGDETGGAGGEGNNGRHEKDHHEEEGGAKEDPEIEHQHPDQHHPQPAEPPEGDSGPQSAPEPDLEPAHEQNLKVPPTREHHEPEDPHAVVMDCPDVAGSGRHLPTLRTSDFYKTCNLPKRFDYPSWFYGYGIQRSPQEHPFYRTTSSDYGRQPPTIHSVPTSFFPNNQEFSKALAKTGMYRNYSLNTGLDPHI